jgi:deoxyribonuclease-1
MFIKLSIFILPLLSASFVFADGNTTNRSFNKAKKALMSSVYASAEDRQTIYCNASFDEKKYVIAPEGFTSKTHVKRSKKIEFEHIVPAQNFGQVFKEWREGDSECVNSKGKAFKGRRCAEKMNDEYRYMQADMYNLYAAIGSVNALRSNYNFQMLPGEQSDFGSCEMIIDNRKAQPPVDSRGRIARAYLYMDQAYSKYSMSKAQKQLMNAWDKQHPITAKECARADKIAAIQGNENLIAKERCSP